MPTNFATEVIEGIKTRTLFVMSRGQKAEYLKNEENTEKMINKKNVLGNGKAFKDHAPYIAVSYYTRACAFEIMYGDPRQEEPNLAHAICRSVLKVSLSIISVMFTIAFS